MDGKRRAVVALAMVAMARLSEPTDAGGLGVEVETYDEWGISQSAFCLKEPISVRIEVRNDDEMAVSLALCTDNRGKLTITNSEGGVVWDSDRAKAIAEEQSTRDKGYGRIIVGPTCRTRSLGPYRTAVWSSTWKQQNLGGEAVIPGKYAVDVAYNYRRDDAGEYEEIRGHAVEITLMDCESEEPPP